MKKRILTITMLSFCLACAKNNGYKRLPTTQIPTQSIGQNLKSESITIGVGSRIKDANNNTIFEEDSVERFEKNNYLTLKFRKNKYRFRIVTDNLEKSKLLNPNTPITNNVGLLFVYEKGSIPCINVGNLQKGTEVIFLDNDGRVNKIARNETNACAIKKTYFAMIVPTNFTFNNVIELNDNIKLEDVETPQDIEPTSVEKSPDAETSTQNENIQETETLNFEE